eukprot:10565538-Lingulodinium_polyedra.AAC.1
MGKGTPMWTRHHLRPLKTDTAAVGPRDATDLRNRPRVRSVGAQRWPGLLSASCQRHHLLKTAHLAGRSSSYRLR